jgi:hypothetical protein
MPHHWLVFKRNLGSISATVPRGPDGDPSDDLNLASLGIVKVHDGRNGDTYPTCPGGYGLRVR